MTTYRFNPWILLGSLLLVCTGPAAKGAAPSDESAIDSTRIEQGRRMYMEGLLPSGKTMAATVSGDIRVTGEQVRCGACHRRSGLGSSEGQEVIPAVVGDLLFAPLRLPTSKPPLAPEVRPAYTDASLKRAIRNGIGAGGKALSPFMPRYTLSDEELDPLIGYLRTLSTNPAPGVGDQAIHFATVVADSVDPEHRKALTDVLEAYFEQKNAGTRNESQRAVHAPWHKKWVFSPYRKWVLHIWELKGSRDSWLEQLESQYGQQPVFAVLSGIAPGSWRPIHDFCNRFQVACLFPTTDLPVIDEKDFYSMYFSKGITLEGEAIARHLADEDLLESPVVQVFRDGDPLGETAAGALRRSLEGRGLQITDFSLHRGGKGDEAFWRSVRDKTSGAVTVLWLGASDLHAFWDHPVTADLPKRVYLSTTVYASEPYGIPESARDRIYFVHPYELPGELSRRLARSTGWLRHKRIYSPKAKQVQANAYFALKMAGEGLGHIRGFFNPEYFLERIEHMVDNATYTSVYPRLSLAPNQRFVSKGSYIAKLAKDGDGGLVAVTDWLIPGTTARQK